MKKLFHLKAILRVQLLISMLCTNFYYAQDSAVEFELIKIDRLIRNKKIDLAQKKTDSLYQKLRKFNLGRTKKIQLLETQFRQAIIFDEIESTSEESLKILLKIIDNAEEENLQSLSCQIYLLIALAYEKSQHLELTNLYLDKAYQKYKIYHLENLYSTYCIRRSSYFRFEEKLDSMNYYAKQAEKFSKKYNNEKDLIDSYLLMGIYESINKNFKKTLAYDYKILEHKKKSKRPSEIAAAYNNISLVNYKMKNYTEALSYNDSAFVFYKISPINAEFYLKLRSMIFERMGKTDSALFYYKAYHEKLQLISSQEEKIKIKKLEEQYQSDKKENTIKNKDKLMILIGSLLAVIAIASILLFGKNRQINHRNKIINQQLGELTQLLKQKQFLLSELQHRVKNNLQHVISILEIQKESADFNNIEELIRGNQNRIHSMALLHKKLNVNDNVNEVDFTRYITELSEIVKESYDNHQKKIKLNINCEIETITIGKALPIGFIIVELISNSMKHAFKNRNIGIINIEVAKGKNGQKNKFYYSDNGDGFDFYQTNEKGLGLEITKGLIDQIDGIVETKTYNGFELIIYYK